MVKGASMKGLIVFYSKSGKTEKVARIMSDTLTIGYRKLKDTVDRRGLFGFLRSSIESIHGICSELEPIDMGLEGYDIIFIGTPVWFMNPAPALNTFIRDSDLQNKKIVLFFTQDMANPASLVKKISKKIQSKGAQVIETIFIKNKMFSDDSDLINFISGWVSKYK